MDNILRDIYQGLLNEHIKYQTQYSVYDFKDMGLDMFIDNYRIVIKDNPTVDYFSKNEFIQKFFIKHYMGNVYIYNNTDIMDFFFDLEDYEEYLIKENRLQKINNLLHK